MITVSIDWSSGEEIYSPIALRRGNTQTLPYLLEAPDITRALTLEYSLENSTITCIFSNHHGHFTEKLLTEDPLGKKIRVYDGGTIIFSGLICDYPTDDDVNRFIVKGDIFSMLEAPINLEISKERFPDMPEDNQGWGNILYGTAAFPVMLKATRVGNNKYHASWTELSDITECICGGESILSEITWYHENGSTFISYTSEEAIIKFSGLGPVDSENNLIENPASMLNQLIADFSAGFALEGVAESQPIFQERNYDGNLLYIDDDSTWKDLLNMFSANFNCRVFPTRDGNLKIKVIRWGMEAPLLTVRPQLLKDFKLRREITTIKKSWVRKYNYNPDEKKYLRTDFDISGGNSHAVGEFQHRWMVKSISSRDVALREAFFLKKPILIYTVSIPKESANLLDLGDTIMIKHRKNVFKNEYRQVQILRENRRQSSGFVMIEGFDMTEINRGTFILREAGHPEVAVLGANEGPTLL